MTTDKSDSPTSAPAPSQHTLHRVKRSQTVQVRAQFRKIFTQMGFEEMPTNSFVESR